MRKIFLTCGILFCLGFAYAPDLYSFNTRNNTDFPIIIQTTKLGLNYWEKVGPHSTSKGWYYKGKDKKIELRVCWAYNYDQKNSKCYDYLGNYSASCEVSPHGQQIVTGSPEIKNNFPSKPPSVSCN